MERKIKEEREKLGLYYAFAGFSSPIKCILS